MAIAGIAAWLLLGRRRRASDEREAVIDEPVSPAGADTASPVEPEPEPAPPPAPSPVERASVEIGMTARRAGTNVTSGAVDYVVTLRNTGSRDAEDVRIDLRALSVGDGSDGQIDAILHLPIDRPVVMPFALAAGQSVHLDGMALIPRQALRALDPAGRGYFVPLLMVNARYRWGEGRLGHSAASFVAGRVQRSGEKLAPFALEGPPRMHDQVEVLRYPVAAMS